ncbi:MAG: BatD family protein [Myxococcota bacterium]|nr:BatD family protein [Myxococcota bacterium]
MAIKRQFRRGLALASVLGLLSGWASTATAAAQARLDRGLMALGERIQLTIRSQGQSMNTEPDLSSLGPDFYVLGQTQSIRTTIINGQRDVSVDWQIELTPLRAGDLEIPAVQVGSDSTEPLRLTVVEESSTSTLGMRNAQPETAGAMPPHLTLSAEVDQASPYVQEQVALTLRLESTRPILSGSLSEPEIPGAILEKLGEDSSRVEEVDGQPLHIFERRYALFPQQSGEFSISPSVFDGEIAGDDRSRNRRNDPFSHSRLDDLMGGSLFDDFFGRSGSLFDQVLGHRGKNVRVISDPIQLTVRERPEQSPGQRWLPAQNLELVEIWGDGSSEPPRFVVGEPVDRIVAVRARGVTASQLPVPDPAETEGLKQYAKPAYEDSQELGGGMVAVRARPTVLIPTRPGLLTLPPVEVDWWDTETDQARTSILPARTLHVEPGDSGTALQASAPPPAAPPQGPSGPAGPAEVEPLLPTDPGSDHAAWIGLGLAGLIGLIGMSAYQRRTLKNTPDPSAIMTPRIRKSRLESCLKRACLEGDAIEAEKALLEIAKWVWTSSTPRSTGEIAARANSPALKEELSQLAASRFANSSGVNWNGVGLWRAYRASELARRRPFHDSHRRQSGLLPELYPSA